MVLKQNFKVTVLAVVFFLLGGLLTGVPEVQASDAIEVGISRVHICEGDSGERDLGDVHISEKEGFPGAISAAGEEIELILPDGVSFRRNDYKKAGWGTEREVYQNMNVHFSSEQVMVVILYGDGAATKQDAFALPLYLDLDDVAEGDLYLTLDGLKSQVPSQELKIAQITDKGIEVSCLQEFSIGTEERGFFIVRLTEKVAGSIDLEDTSFRLTLPEGVFFDAEGKQGNVEGISITGSGAFAGTDSLNDSEIEDNRITFYMEDLGNLTRSSDESRGMLDIYVNVVADVAAESGAVVLEVQGQKDIDDCSVTVGQIGDFEVLVEADVPEVLSGAVGQELGAVVITEGISGSLITGENIRITLPEDVKLTGPYDITQVEVSEGVELELVKSDESEVTFKLESVGAGSEAEIEIPLTVNIEAGFTGDIEVELSGRAGVQGDLTVGTAILPVTVSIEAVNPVQIGQQNQALAVITIQENQGRALKQGNEFMLHFPEGIQLQPGVRAEVTEGNLEIESVHVVETTNIWEDAALTFQVKSESTRQQPSTIEIYNAQIAVSSLMEPVEVVVEVMGSAVVQSFEGNWLGADTEWNYHDYPAEAFASQDAFQEDVEEYLFNQDVLAYLTVAQCVAKDGSSAETPEMSSLFNIGKDTALIQGEEQDMSVAPYISEGRTMLPVRYVAYACGVTAEGIVWDADTRTVTLTAGDTVVKLVIGEKTIQVNNETLQMDAAPEITDGYTFLPARYVAEAFGYGIQWDADTQGVIITKAQ